MRSIEERMAEISRRSEKIFAQRKKRRRLILSVCIPVVLCTSIFALTHTGEKTAGQADRETQQEVYNGMSIQFSGTQGQQFELFFDQLDDQSIPAQGSISNNSNGADEWVPENAPEAAPNDAVEDAFISDSLADETVTLYSFCLPLEDGSSNEYRLNGNILENLTTGEQFLLTDDQVDQLLQLLDMDP